MLVLYQLATLLFPGPTLRKTAFLTATLHVLSPAGLFLSAPYGEALFSLLNFSGMLCYAYARVRLNGHAAYFLCILASGLCFGLATMVRTNGLLSGLILLYDVFRSLPGLLGPNRAIVDTFVRLIGAILAGFMVASGLIIPQLVAYQQYCTLVGLPRIRPNKLRLTQTRTMPGRGVQSYHLAFILGYNIIIGRLVSLYISFPNNIKERGLLALLDAIQYSAISASCPYSMDYGMLCSSSHSSVCLET